ncbi:MAG: FliA/WhiG family RNA polymerase sigma factor [Acetobacteraceae bacterium]|nr:FliA/WhiG family RNA polymerase sigma factor [Acetobacteraceae bacterium]
MAQAAALRNERDLWLEYKRNGSSEARESLILGFAPLVKYVAGRLMMGLPSHVEVNDLISYGIFGLLDAMEKFDPDRGVKFETYAVARIKGAILDGLRAWDWVPPSLRRRAHEVEEAYARLEQKLGRNATDQEVAEALQVDLAEFHRILADLSRANLASLDDLWSRADREEGGRPASEVIQDEGAPDPAAVAEFEDMRRLVAEAVAALPERERLVVTLYYYEGLTVKEISEVLHVTPSRISQLHSRAVMRLRGKLCRLKEHLV